MEAIEVGTKVRIISPDFASNARFEFNTIHIVIRIEQRRDRILYWIASDMWLTQDEFEIVLDGKPLKELTGQNFVPMYNIKYKTMKDKHGKA